MVFGIEDTVRHLFALEHAAQQLGRLDASGAHQHGLAAAVGFLDFGDDSVVLLAPGLVDAVVGILAQDAAVRRDNDHAQLVDVVELVGLGFGGAGHAGQLLVQAEVILDGDRGERLRRAVDLDAFLGRDGLVQAVTPTPSRHFAAGALVHDDDFIFFHDVFYVAFVQAVGT